MVTLEQALSLLKQKKSIIPIGRDKVAGIGWKKYQEEYATEDEVRKWFANGNRNLAIVTGKISGITVVDIDPRHGGTTDFLPQGTTIVKTGNGGYHYYFKYEKGIKNGNNVCGKKGIDIRGEGGYVVSPYSETEYIDDDKKSPTFGKIIGGKYSLISQNDFLPFPKHLFPKILEDKESQVLELSDGVHSGSRNESATVIAGGFIRAFPTKPETAFKLLQDWNKNNTPPLSPYELKSVFNSILNRDKKKPKRFEPEDDEGELVVRSLSGIKPTNIKWLWHSRLAKGKITLFQGDPGLGKSQVTIYLASVISKGVPFIDDSQCEQGKVLFITAEDDAADTLKPRLMAQDANMDNIFELQWVKVANGKTKLFNFDKYMEQLRATVKSMPDLKLIIVDPISAFLGKVDGNATGEVRGLLYELKCIAEDSNCSVVLVTHNNKNSGQKALSRASGSHAFGAAARMAYIFGNKPVPDTEDQPEEPEFAMAPLKNNLTKNPDTLLYVIESAKVVGESGEEIATSKISWRGTHESTGQEIVDYNPMAKVNKAGAPKTSALDVERIIKEISRDKNTISPEEFARIKEIVFDKGINEKTFKKTYKEMGFKSLSENNRWYLKRDTLDSDFDNV